MNHTCHAATRLLAPACLFILSASVFAEEVRFNRDVRPILSDKCYFCHGPDEENRAAGLRLDLAEESADAIESGELLRRIHSDDEYEQMPPPETKLSLTEAEKKTLEAWIKQGAEYEGHWAFALLPDEVPVPAIAGDDWSKGPLDRFVREELSRKDLPPNAAADPHRWLRRVTFDLTGLPPTLAEIDAFQTALAGSDDRDKVYAAEVDRLLASPAFGEHMAVAWLDAARYADSYGYQSDKLNTQWPYRDWVVRAFNDNLPYDKFLTWQLAGDLLSGASQGDKAAESKVISAGERRDQILATAFNRIHRLNNEGGAVYEEWRKENVADRVQTFGTAVLGLTLECCRCHDHKYDPIPMRDYYSLAAFFNSIDESGVYDRSEKVPCPSLLLPTQGQQLALEKAKLQLKLAQAKYEQQLSAARERYAEWKSKSGEQKHAIPDLKLALSFDVPFDNKLKEIYHPSEGDRGWTQPPKLVSSEENPLPRLAVDQAAEKIVDANPSRRAIQFDGERGIATKGVEPIDRWTPFSVVVTFRETKRHSQRTVIAHNTRGTDCGYNGWDLTIEDGYLESKMARVWPGNAICVRATDPLPKDEWHQVSATYDGSSQAEGLKLYLNGKLLQTEVVRNDLKKSANVAVDHGGEFVIGQRFRDRGFAGGQIDDVRLYARDLTPIELVHLATAKPINPSPEYYASAIDERSRQAAKALAQAHKKMVMAEEVMHEIPVMAEMDTPRETHVLARGEYNAPTSEKTRVDRHTFSDLQPSLPEGAPRNRLGLAQWVTLPNHPLTARVAVNRLWANFFGYGLVRTPENFGLQGELPTHPDLLDWLARDFVSSGWDVKQLCKSIVLSATYRQDSRATYDLIESDPENRLLARGPAYRFDAEQIRDLALFVSGRLHTKIGGPPVSPYQPGKDLWKESNDMSPAYKQSVGKDLYRRSLYSVWKRTAPLPNMMAFDTQSREVCTVKRARTNTPMQALVLLNDVQFVEAARLLAERALEEADTTKSQIAWAFCNLTGRLPDEGEARLLAELHEDEAAYYDENPDEAVKLINIGESKPGDSYNKATLAALTATCQAILNLDATIWKR